MSKTKLINGKRYTITGEREQAGYSGSDVHHVYWLRCADGREYQYTECVSRPVFGEHRRRWTKLECMEAAH
jgi:hypothetical protein